MLILESGGRRTGIYFMKTKISLVYIFLVFSCYAKEIQLTILHTNDHHGRFFRNKYGEYGLAARKTLIDQLRQSAFAEGREVLLLSGGDINTGIPESDTLDAEPDFKGMKLLGYDAMAVGNHEFDNDLKTIFKQQDWAGFPFLSANIFYKKPVGGFLGFFADKKPFKSYIIKKFKNINIAIFGLTTTDTPQKVNPIYLENIIFKSPIDTARELVPKLRKESDIVIAVTHMGHFDNGNHGIEAPGDVTLARLVNGIDIIVGGHTQKALFRPDIQNGTLIVQAHEWGKFVGKIDLTYKDGSINLDDYELIPVNLKKKITLKDGTEKRVFIQEEIKEDEMILNFLTPYQEKGSKNLDQVIASTKVLLEGARAVTTTQDTYLSILINRAYRESLGADISIMNSGGIRASIEPGEITYRDILTVLPFGGTLAQVELRGFELKEYLRKLIFSQEKTSNGYPHFAGLTYSTREFDLVNIKINGTELKLEQTYKVVLPEFLTTGGDKYPPLSKHPGFVDTGLNDALVFKNYLLKLKNIDESLFK